MCRFVNDPYTDDPYITIGYTDLDRSSFSIQFKDLIGTIKWEIELGTDVHSPAIGEDGTIYVGTYNKGLFAVGEKPSEGLESYVIGIAIGLVILVSIALLLSKTKRKQ